MQAIAVVRFSLCSNSRDVYFLALFSRLCGVITLVNEILATRSLLSLGPYNLPRLHLMTFHADDPLGLEVHLESNIATTNQGK